MDSGKKIILAWGTSSDDTEVGIPPKYVRLLENEFKVVWERDVEADPEVGLRVQGVLSTADRPPRIVFERPELFPNLRVLVSISAGLDHLDLPSLRSRGIRLAATASFTDAVAEMALALLLSLSRDIPSVSQMAGTPDRRMSRMVWDSPGILGTRVGFVGFGRIGMRTAELLVPHRCRVAYYDPVRRSSEEELRLNATWYSDLHQLLRESDSVVITCWLNKDTVGLIGEKALRCMKRTAILINVARGKIVETPALTTALREGRLRGAGLDVTEPDYLPQGHPLLSMENVLLTSHCAGSTEPTMEAAFRDAVLNMSIGLRGETMPKEVHL